MRISLENILSAGLGVLTAARISGASACKSPTVSLFSKYPFRVARAMPSALLAMARIAG